MRATGFSVIRRGNAEFEVVASGKPTIRAPGLGKTIEKNGIGHGGHVGTVLLAEVAPGDFHMKGFYPFSARFEQFEDFIGKGLGLEVLGRIVPELRKNGGKTFCWKYVRGERSSFAIKFVRNLGMEWDVPYSLEDLEARIAAAKARGRLKTALAAGRQA
ncbi:Uncharacterised protein [Candidatus Norongarragalina meridionalis]|nr:Uncharacterised protein [Candidatus Norongarragalina meridionalis]